MKKIGIMLFAFAVGFAAFGEIEQYEFKSNIKWPVVQGSAKSGYYRNYVSTAVNGWLTVDSDASTNVLEVTVKKTGESFVMDVPADSDLIAVIYGKKSANAAVLFKATDEDGRFAISCAGLGSVRVKTTGSSCCGTSTTCTRVYKLSGNLVGSYDCECENPQYITIDDTCEVSYDKDTTVAPVYGTWNITLKYVDGAKYR